MIKVEGERQLMLEVCREGTCDLLCRGHALLSLRMGGELHRAHLRICTWGWRIIRLSIGGRDCG